jgi:hypothetical protein
MTDLTSPPVSRPSSRSASAPPGRPLEWVRAIVRAPGRTVVALATRWASARRVRVQAGSLGDSLTSAHLADLVRRAEARGYDRGFDRGAALGLSLGRSLEALRWAEERRRWLRLVRWTAPRRGG